MKHLLPFLLLSLGATGCFKEEVSDIQEGRSGSMTRFAIHQGFMYLLNQNEVQTWSLDNPDQPQLVHRLATNFGLETIFIYEGTMFIGSRTALYILGIDHPAQPEVLSRTPRQGPFRDGCDPVVVKGQYAFSTVKTIQNVCGQINTFSALLVYDVTDLTLPLQIGSYPMHHPNGLGYKDNFLFVCDEGSGTVEVFDITNPEQLVLTSYGIPLPEAQDLIVDGDHLIVSSRSAFRFYDIQDITDIRPLGQIAK